jgi:hypothetical protein
MSNQKSTNHRQQPVIVESKTDDTLSPAQLAEIWARRAYELAQEPPAPSTGKTFRAAYAGAPHAWFCGRRI